MEVRLIPGFFFLRFLGVCVHLFFSFFLYLFLHTFTFCLQSCDCFVSCRWCRDCVELHIDIFYPNQFSLICRWEQQEWCNRVMDQFRSKLYAELQWMTSLKKIFLTRTGCLTFTDLCCNAFSRWLLLELKPPSLEHVWLPSVKDVTLDLQLVSDLTRAHLGRNFQDSDANSLIINEKLTHLAGVNLTSIGHSPQLSFVHGYCSSFAVLDLLQFFIHLLPFMIQKFIIFFFQGPGKVLPKSRPPTGTFALWERRVLQGGASAFSMSLGVASA